MSELRLLEQSCEWTSDQLEDESIWTEQLDENECDELDAALRHALAESSDVLDIDRSHFPLPTLSGRLGQIEQELIEGRGFVRIRGIDSERYGQDEMEMLYWGIGMHLGKPWPQNKHGHVLGDVIDQGVDLDDPEIRGNQIGAAALPFHCDGSDLVGLMCLSDGVEGGLSLVANSVRIHNTLVREDPDLALELYKPQPYHFRGEQPPGGKSWYTVPVFIDHGGRLFMRAIPPYIAASQMIEDAPRLTSTAKAGLKRLVALAEDPTNHIAMQLRAGDMQFINNYHVMHGRTAYTDDPESGRIRHLKRLWLETKAFTSRPEGFSNSGPSHWVANRSVSRLRTD
ncbi:MAG: TauD/TfdA family dioxygenase [Acidobacteria bacterium]|nr:TauD/TfdA family dioxygenase [Acidobacteriota bacterium]